jgi:large subunit ribosomal protein L16
MFINFFNPPAKLKFKKFHKTCSFNKLPQLRFISSNFLNVVFLKAVTHGRLTLNHLEAARKVIRRKMKKTGVMKAYVFPYVSITHKALAVRMGKGKGAISNWIFPIRPGRVIFEIHSAPLPLALEALVMSSKKLPIRTKVFSFFK